MALFIGALTDRLPSSPALAAGGSARNAARGHRGSEVKGQGSKVRGHRSGVKGRGSKVRGHRSGVIGQGS